MNGFNIGFVCITHTQNLPLTSLPLTLAHSLRLKNKAMVIADILLLDMEEFVLRACFLLNYSLSFTSKCLNSLVGGN